MMTTPRPCCSVVLGALTFAVALLGRPAAVAATGDGPVSGNFGGSGVMAAAGIVVVAELAFPDFRFEVGSDEKEEDTAGITMSWPIFVWLGAHRVGKTWMVTAEPFLEGQYRSTGDRQRLLLGARHTFAPRGGAKGVAIEYAGVIGNDGRGAMFGVAPVHLYDPRIQLGLVLRGIVTNQGWRMSMAFDVHFAVL